MAAKLVSIGGGMAYLSEAAVNCEVSRWDGTADSICRTTQPTTASF